MSRFDAAGNRGRILLATALGLERRTLVDQLREEGPDGHGQDQTLHEELQRVSAELAAVAAQLSAAGCSIDELVTITGLSPDELRRAGIGDGP